MGKSIINPLEELDLNINPKGVFQPMSSEAKRIKHINACELLVFFVKNGYDLHRIVLDFLKSRVALDDFSRIHEITFAFNLYSKKLDIQNKQRNINIHVSNQKDILKFYEEYIYDSTHKQIFDFGEDVKFYIDVIVEIEKFIKKAKTSIMPHDFSLKSLIKAYLHHDKQKYNFLSKLWQIEIDEDIKDKIIMDDEIFKENFKYTSHIDNVNDLWTKESLYEYFKNVVLSNLKMHRLSFINPSYEEKCAQYKNSQYINSMIKKFFPLEDHDKLREDNEFCDERLIEITEKLIRILWLNEPAFTESVYYARCNYPIGDLANQYLDELYEKNLIAICIKDNKIEQEYDMVLFSKLLNNLEVKYDNKLNYIHRFFDIVNRVKYDDVIVVGSYLGYPNVKLGLVKKGSEIIRLKKDGLTFFCLQMKSVYCNPFPNFWGRKQEKEGLNLFDFPILKSVIPYRTTFSPIIKNRNKIYSLYYGYPLMFELDSLSEEGVEIMCTEWIRSKYAPKHLRINYQLLKTGGNFEGIDILGCNENNEIVTCQVTIGSSKSIIEKKTNGINKFEADYKIIFSNNETRFSNDILYKNLVDVFDELKNDSTYNVMLEKLIYN